MVLKILAINGSHRKGRNTAAMLGYVLEEARAHGADTELLEVTDYNIKHCLSCNRCLRQPKCSIEDDDVAMLGEKILAADGIVLGSPVYFGNVTSRLKTLMDRLRWMHVYQNLLEGKVGAAVVHAGLRNGGQELALSILERYLTAQGLILAHVDDPTPGSLLNAGAMGTMFEAYDGQKTRWKKEVSEDLIAVECCRRLGRNMVKLIRRLQGSTHESAAHENTRIKPATERACN